MGRILLSDGGEYHRPERPHLFPPGLRAAAHFLKAVDKVNGDVRKQLVEIGKTHYLPQLKRGQNGCATPDLWTTTPEGPQREKELEMGRQFLEAIQHWLDKHHVGSPFVFDLAYKTLQLWRDIRRGRQDCEDTIQDWEADPEPLTEAERGMLDTKRDRVKFLKDELKGWGWWVDFLSSDISVPQLQAWQGASGLRPHSVPGVQLLNMPSSPTDAALWIYERLWHAASKTHGLSSLSEDNQKLLKRGDDLRIDISWEQAGPAPRFQLVMAGWRPEEETWAAAKARFESGFKQQLKGYRAAIEKRLQSGQLHPRPKDSAKAKWGEPHRWEPVPTKYGDEHFHWLALRQVKGLRPHEIASREGSHRTVSTVNEAIEGTARLLQLKLRPVRPGPPAVLGD